jgi:hypothetical protein
VGERRWPDLLERKVQRGPTIRLLRGKMSSGQSADREVRAEAIARKDFERAPKGKLPSVMRGNVTSDHKLAMNFFDVEISNPVVSRLANASLELVYQRTSEGHGVTS